MSAKRKARAAAPAEAPRSLIDRMTLDLLKDGPRWRAARKASGLTLGEASEAGGLSLVRLSNVERGLELPSIPEAKRLLAVYRQAAEDAS